MAVMVAFLILHSIMSIIMELQQLINTHILEKWVVVKLAKEYLHLIRIIIKLMIALNSKDLLLLTQAM